MPHLACVVLAQVCHVPCCKCPRKFVAQCALRIRSGAKCRSVVGDAGDENEVYCELVQGLGESLVSGMVPGSALSFSAPKSDVTQATVLTCAPGAALLASAC